VAQTLSDTVPHQAIYRRFRAQTFAQIVGQPAVVETLRNAVRLNRLGHGFLFVGPRGTGKTSMARILAKAVNCTNLVDGEPDDTCPSCVAIREGRALDVVELDAASNNRVDDMRELLPRVYTTAADLRHKVFIIDEVQRIKEGWDVLLKTLEEPPPGVLFIFCTTDPSQIRPAVVSRLQRFTFRPLSLADIEGKLQRILVAEGRTVEPEGLALVAELAAGGMRDAESMLDQVLGNADDPITASAIRDLIGLAEMDAVDRFVSALAFGDTLAGMAILDALEADGRDVVAFAEQVVIRLRHRLIERLGGRSLVAGEIDAAYLARAARRLSGIDASRSGLGGYRWQLELALLGGATGSPTDTLLPDMAAASRAAPATQAAPPEQAANPPPAASAPPAAPVTASAAATEREIREERGRRGRTSPPSPSSPSPSLAPPLSADRSSASTVPPAPPDELLARLRQKWPEVVAWISRSPANRPLIEACRPVEIRDGVVVLGFPENRAFLREKAEQRRTAFEEGLQQVLGRPIGVRCVVTNVELLEPIANESDDLVEQARRIFEGDLADVADIT
jgi:DNA polymerase-3 subunit gamma/tau